MKSTFIAALAAGGMMLGAGQAFSADEITLQLKWVTFG